MLDPEVAKLAAVVSALREISLWKQADEPTARQFLTKLAEHGYKITRRDS